MYRDILQSPQHAVLSPESIVVLGIAHLFVLRNFCNKEKEADTCQMGVMTVTYPRRLLTPR